MSEEIPVVTKCEEDVKDTIFKVNKSFIQKYGGLEPDFFVRVPGRVNLIGEHVDYCGYSVCPMAIKQCIMAAVKTIDSPDVILSNVEDEKYSDYSCNINNLSITNDPGSAPYWYDYVLCGLKGILEIAREIRTKGIMMHVYGTIPPASGLSSSSALVCCAALSLSVALNITLTKRELAEITAKAERYIGTEGGGMDQAIIFNGKEGTASHISFNPLTLTEVHIPASGAFVIAQSLATKNKAASSDYNCRVAECRLSALLIGKHYLKDWKNFTRLADVQKELNFDLKKMLKIVQELFHDGFYLKEEVSQILNITEKELDEKFLPKNTRHLKEFKLQSRALHVFGEALRVKTFCEICNTTKSLAELGQLMEESHISLKDLYECSHEELDKLVALSALNGALGTRLTGAGWGGCVVSLVPLNIVDEFVKSLKREFYAKKTPSSVNIDQLIFATKPYNGATVFRNSVLDDIVDK